MQFLMGTAIGYIFGRDFRRAFITIAAISILMSVGYAAGLNVRRLFQLMRYSGGLLFVEVSLNLYVALSFGLVGFVWRQLAQGKVEKLVCPPRAPPESR